MGENITKIKYLLVGGCKLYQVTHIDFYDLILEARECDLDVGDVPKEEVFCLEDFGEFRIRLVNRRGQAEIIDFEKLKERHVM